MTHWVCTALWLPHHYSEMLWIRCCQTSCYRVCQVHNVSVHGTRWRLALRSAVEALEKHEPTEGLGFLQTEVA
jgi:hypothetical protein